MVYCVPMVYCMMAFHSEEESCNGKGIYHVHLDCLKTQTTNNLSMSLIFFVAPQIFYSQLMSEPTHPQIGQYFGSSVLNDLCKYYRDQLVHSLSLSCLLLIHCRT